MLSQPRFPSRSPSRASRLLLVGLAAFAFVLPGGGLAPGWTWQWALLAQEPGGRLVTPPPRSPEIPAPAPLSDFERKAIEWLAAYLASEHTDSSDPLAAQLTRLFGPPAGSVWRLATPGTADPRQGAKRGVAYFEVELATGVEHWLRLEPAPGSTELRPSRLALASEPAWSGRGRPGTTAGASEVGASGVSTSEVDGLGADGAEPEGGLSGRQETALGLLLGAVAALGLSLLDRRAKPFFQALAALGVLAGALAWFGVPGLPGFPSPGSSDPAGGSPSEAEGSGPGGSSRNHGLDPRLETAQRALASRRLGEAERALAELDDSPAVGLLRARLVFERLQVVDAALAYEQQLETWPELDAVLYEIIRAFETLDYDDRAEKAAERLLALGSRRGELHYYLARRALIDRSTTRALAHFRHGWALEPLHRQALLRDPVLAWLVFESPEMMATIAFGSAEEPTVPCGFERRPVSWPPEVSIHTLGGLLWMESGARPEGPGARLEVPAGCGLAPAGHEGEDAEAWRRRREGRVLSQLAAIGVAGSEDAVSGSEIPGPVADLRTAPEVTTGRVPWSVTEEWPASRLAEAVEVLARRQDWKALVTLTDGAEASSLDTESARWRAWALQSIGREADAGRLLVKLVTSDMVEKRADPESLRQLAEWLVKVQEYDRALDLLAKADALVPYETSGRRLLQVRMEKRLFRSAAEETSEHFRLVFPPEQGFLYAEEVLGVLESERDRLARFVPRNAGAPREKIDVLMLDANDFRASYGGMNVLGLFDGRIRLPLGELPTLQTEIEAVDAFLANLVTHELAHALIAEATGDRAPHWFQEGLAQHVEPVQQGINPIPSLADRGHWIPFPLLDAVLKYSRLPEWTNVAYDQVRWVLHWVEDEHGVGAIHELLDAFRRGSDTEEAIEEVFGLDTAELDRELLRWGREEAPELWRR